MAGKLHFDAKLFERTVRVVGLEMPARLVARSIQCLGADVLRETHVKPVRPAGKADRRVLLLSAEKFRSLAVGNDLLLRLSEALQLPRESFAEEMSTESGEAADARGDATIADVAPLEKRESGEEEEKEESVVRSVWCDVQLDFRSRPVEELLAHYLPDGMEVISGFETIGHIAHLNLREAHAPYRSVIGEIILAKNPSLRTVVTKVGNIKTTFRTFPMEVIAGEKDLLATVSESGCKFRVDFENCYWNSRLAMEHTRLVDHLHPDDVVCDMMAGIGPFAVPAAKKGCLVFANDLNPTSYKFLCENRELNHISQQRLNAYNEDATEFVKQMVSRGVRFSQVIMNLPASAYTFLPVFVGLFNDRPPAEDVSQYEESSSTAGLSGKAKAAARRAEKLKDEARKKPRHWKKLEKELPWIHCYGFSSAEDPKEDFLNLVKATLGVTALPGSEVREVRDVAPTKRMILVSFPLPVEVAFAKRDVEAAGVKRAAGVALSGASESKKVKADDKE